MPTDRDAASFRRWLIVKIVFVVAVPMFACFSAGAFWLSDIVGSDFVLGVLAVLLVVVAGIGGSRFEKWILRSFRCPTCSRRIPDYELDKKGYVSYVCRECDTRWHLKYSVDSNR